MMSATLLEIYFSFLWTSDSFSLFVAGHYHKRLTRMSVDFFAAASVNLFRGVVVTSPCPVI